MIFYRYRSAKAIFEFQELENQTIYFAPKESLNDPLEGNLNVQWKGDQIAWKGLFGNYICSLDQMVQLNIKQRNSKSDDCNKISNTKVLLNKIIFQKDKEIMPLKEQFLSEPCIQDLIQIFSMEEIVLGKAELKLFLKLIHNLALQLIFRYTLKNNIKNNHILDSQFLWIKRIEEIDQKEFLAKKALIKCSERNQKKRQEYYKKIQDAITTAELTIIANLPKNLDEKEKKWMYLYFDYPDEYVESLLTAIHPKCYVACFSETGTNSSMWGNYADHHKGICMMFQAKKQKGVYSIPVQLPSIKQKEFSKIKYQDFILKKVEYGGKSGNVNFFTMLGSMEEQRLKEWLMDETGKKSWCLDKIKQNPDSWEKEYWEYFENRYHRKTADWEYEREYRLQLGNGRRTYQDVQERCLKYPFRNLYGIIFGISTPMEYKVKIMRIIQRLCEKENRKDFLFCQAHYNNEVGRIKIEKLKSKNENREE